MDGNGTWANKKNLSRTLGHQAGIKTVRMIIEESRKLGVEYITLYAFSTENWGRPETEVNTLMGLFTKYLKLEINDLIKNNIRVRHIGDLDSLPKNLKELFIDSEEKSKDCDGMNLVLAVSYGAKEEITNACKKISSLVKENKIEIDEINEDLFSKNLYTADIPDPDLLIRTSGQSRISNFLLWQLAYSEIIITDTLWPDFKKENYLSCLLEYENRNRKYGKAVCKLENKERQVNNSIQ
ncbi:UNVERIFIED_CONTAM: hypothetical protein GTU68_014594 [Idotea baltica]|nr:hypothetical protein [Idotea baltica]